MSMTREEAMEVLENGGWWDMLIPVTTIEGRIEDNKLQEALDLALSALRPVSREQVERVRGYWIEDEYSFSHCSLCGYEQDEPELITPFCPNCGAPLTDEAVEMVMERLEALKDAGD